jgi:hypothetical protein
VSVLFVFASGAAEQHRFTWMVMHYTIATLNTRYAVNFSKKRVPSIL